MLYFEFAILACREWSIILRSTIVELLHQYAVGTAFGDGEVPEL